MEFQDFKRVVRSYIREIEKLEQTNYLNGQLLSLNKLLTMANFTEIQEFYKGNLFKTEDMVFRDKPDNETLKGYLMGLYKGMEFMRNNRKDLE